MIIRADRERSVLHNPKDSQEARSAVGLHSRVMCRVRILSMENRIGTRPWSSTSIVVSGGGMAKNHRVTFSWMRRLTVSPRKLGVKGRKSRLNLAGA